MKKALIILTILTLAMTAIPAMADAPAAIDWLRGKQAADGGFAGDFSDGSSMGATAEGIFALVAQGESPADWQVDGNTPISYIEANADSLTLPGDVAQAALAILVSGGNPRDVAGVDLVAQTQSLYDEPSGLFGGTENSHVFGQSLSILLLTAVDETVPQGAIDWLIASQIEDGSWSWNGDSTPGTGDTNSTAIAVQALVAVGSDNAAADSAIGAAIVYFATQQNDDGGFPYQKPSPYGTDTDANSTAYAVQALIAAGENLADWGDPQAALLALQKENGAFQWQAAVPDDNFLATTQSLAALSGKSYVDLAAGSMEPPAMPEQLPESGGAGSVNLALLLGAAMLGAGLFLRRRWVR